MKKKMILTPERRAEVTKPGRCYVIRWVPCHPDDEGKTECEAGFFSLFIRALYGIRFSVHHNTPYYVDYGHIPYSYSDPEKFAGDTNFWNYYFRQPMASVPSVASSVVNTAYETFPLRIWDRSFIRSMHKIVRNHITLQPAVEAIVKEKRDFFRRRKVLGVHIRRTDHPGEVEPVALSTFKKAIYEKFGRMLTAFRREMRSVGCSRKRSFSVYCNIVLCGIGMGCCGAAPAKI